MSLTLVRRRQEWYLAWRSVENGIRRVGLTLGQAVAAQYSKDESPDGGRETERLGYSPNEMSMDAIKYHALSYMGTSRSCSVPSFERVLPVAI